MGKLSTDEATNSPIVLTRPALTTPRAAAIAGIIFAVLFTISIFLVRLAIPEELAGTSANAWLVGNSGSISLALTLVPFAGIAFLWFMGVVRDRLGKLEDQFFATVFFGSGLLFLAMMFASAAVAGATLTSYALVSDTLILSGMASFARSLIATILNIYAIRMAGVFMLSLGTLWFRTQVMPRGFAFLSFALALVMLVSINLSLWLILVLPAWVCLISVYILMVSLRREKASADDVTQSTG